MPGAEGWELVLDDRPFDAAADRRRRAGERAGRRLRQVGLIWIFHGAVLVSTAGLMGAIWAGYALARPWILRELDLRRVDHLADDILRLDRLVALMRWAVPVSLLLGIVVLVAAVGCLGRRRRAWRWLRGLSWLHLVGLIPAYVAFAVVAERSGLTEGISPAFRVVSHVMNAVLVLATQLLLGWVHHHLVSPPVRALFAGAIDHRLGDAGGGRAEG